VVYGHSLTFGLVTNAAMQQWQMIMFNFTRDAFGSHLLTYSPTLKVDKNLNTTINLITLITIN
jgi:hypothetical protein